MTKCIKIEGCGECPFVSYPPTYGYEDSVSIKCAHPEQSESRVEIARIRSVRHNIYFPCPLPDYQEREETND